MSRWNERFRSCPQTSRCDALVPLSAASWLGRKGDLHPQLTLRQFSTRLDAISSRILSAPWAAAPCTIGATSIMAVLHRHGYPDWAQKLARAVMRPQRGAFFPVAPAATSLAATAVTTISATNRTIVAQRTVIAHRRASAATDRSTPTRSATVATSAARPAKRRTRGRKVISSASQAASRLTLRAARLVSVQVLYSRAFVIIFRPPRSVSASRRAHSPRLTARVVMA